MPPASFATTRRYGRPKAPRRCHPRPSPRRSRYRRPKTPADATGILRHDAQYRRPKMPRRSRPHPSPRRAKYRARRRLAEAARILRRDAPLRSRHRSATPPRLIAPFRSAPDPSAHGGEATGCCRSGCRSTAKLRRSSSGARGACSNAAAVPASASALSLSRPTPASSPLTRSSRFDTLRRGVERKQWPMLFRAALVGVLVFVLLVFLIDKMLPRRAPAAPPPERAAVST